MCLTIFVLWAPTLLAKNCIWSPHLHQKQKLLTGQKNAGHLPNSYLMIIKNGLEPGRELKTGDACLPSISSELNLNSWRISPRSVNWWWSYEAKYFVKSRKHCYLWLLKSYGIYQKTSIKFQCLYLQNPFSMLFKHNFSTMYSLQIFDC